MGQLVQLQESIEDFEDNEIGLVAISVDPVEVSARMKAENKLTYPLLSDVGAPVIKAYDVFDPLPRISKPAAFVVDPEGVVRWKRVGENKMDVNFGVEILIAAIPLVPGAEPTPEPRPVSPREKAATTWAELKQDDESR